jgi:hypothetical protein
MINDVDHGICNIIEFANRKAAVETGFLSLLSISGVNVNSSIDGGTLFLFAVTIGSQRLIEELLKLPEIDVNAFNEPGTPLMIALHEGRPRLPRHDSSARKPTSTMKTGESDRPALCCLQQQGRFPARSNQLASL